MKTYHLKYPLVHSIVCILLKCMKVIDFTNGLYILHMAPLSWGFPFSITFNISYLSSLSTSVMISPHSTVHLTHYDASFQHSLVIFFILFKVLFLEHWRSSLSILTQLSHLNLSLKVFLAVIPTKI